MRIVVKFIALFAGCFALGAALVSFVMWGVFIALTNYHGIKSPETLPAMTEVIVCHLVYSLEMALGLLLVRWAFHPEPANYAKTK